jgi:hypothetical protein
VRPGRTAIATWCRWTAATTLGVFLAFRVVGLFERLALPVPAGPWTDTVNTAALAVGMGPLLGLCQALALLPRLRAGGALAWTVATA